jgi:NADH dehydrogenase
MAQKQQVVTVVGGTGFLGRYVVRELAKAGFTVRVISRNADSALFLKTAGHVGQVVLQKGDITRPETLQGKLDGSFAVVNLVGTLLDRGRQNFAAIHAQGAERLAKEAAKAGAERFVQISAIGVNKSQNAKYARTKANGEKAVTAAFADATILRPGILFGAEDNFYNQFARMACFAPALPLIGGGDSRFQPVYVADVARAVLAVIQTPSSAGKIYELGGPRIYSFREILEYVLATTHRKRKLANIPFGAALLMGALGELTPVPPLTRDQVQMLKYDNVVDSDSYTLADLGIAAMPVEMVVPNYLKRYRSRKPNTRVTESTA